MGEYQIARVLSLTALLESPRHYGRLSKAKKPLLHTSQTKYDGTFVTAIVPLEDESENRAIDAWIYKDEVPIDLTEQASEITPEKYDLGLGLMKHYGYKGIGPIGYNNNGLIDPIIVIAHNNRDSTGLGFKKVPFHLGINKFVPKPECLIECELQAESNVPKDSDDGEDLYPYPIPHNLAKLFVKPHEFVP